MKKLLDSLVDKVNKKGNDGVSGGFSHLRGGAGLTEVEGTHVACTNQLSCSGTNYDGCINQYECSTTTNNGGVSGGCTNTMQCID